MDNRRTLDKELQETYGESIQELQRADSRSRLEVIRLRKLQIPPLVVKQIVRRVERVEPNRDALVFAKPSTVGGQLVRRSFDLSPSLRGKTVLTQVGDVEIIATDAETVDVYTAATKLAAVYRFDLWAIKAQLATLYSDGEVPEAHLPDLAAQLERHTSNYEVKEEEIEVALALVKPSGFPGREIDAAGTEIYTAEISVPIARESLLLSWQKLIERNGADFGFHFNPYNFDSGPELDFFEQMLRELNLCPDEVEDIYFTGAFTSSNKTDFLIEYRDVDGRWRNYAPDFLIRKKPAKGRQWRKCLIVEIKAVKSRVETDSDFNRDGRGEMAATKEGRKALALKKWTGLNPERLRYEILYVDTTVPDNEFEKARKALNSLD